MGSVVTPVRENFDRGMVHAKSILDRAILLRILCPHTEARAVLWDAMMTFPEAPSRHVQLRGHRRCPRGRPKDGAAADREEHDGAHHDHEVRKVGL